MNGAQVKKYTLAGTGENSLKISASELGAGMYYYTLLANGDEVDTKKMILTN